MRLSGRSAPPPYSPKAPKERPDRRNAALVICGLVAIAVLQAIGAWVLESAPVGRLEADASKFRTAPSAPRNSERDDEREKRRLLADAAIDRLADAPTTAATVVCRTLTSAAVYPLLEEAAERDLEEVAHSDAPTFLQRVVKLCGDGSGGLAADAAGYTGRWAVDGAPTADDLVVLRALLEWIDAPPWDPPPPLPADWAPSLLKETGADGCVPAYGAGDANGRCYILDFGCGRGEELVQIGEQFGLPASQLLGIDVYDDPATTYTRHVLANPDDDEAYCASLEALGATILEATGGAGVTIAVSSVTFHHVPTRRMRECVLAFLRRVLAPARGAAFLLREWDDASGRTEIWFDLAHALPSWAMPATQLPSEPGALRQHGCSYSSWQTYEAQAAAAGLAHNRSVQQAMFGSTPLEMANGAYPARNFEAVFTVGS